MVTVEKCKSTEKKETCKGKIMHNMHVRYLIRECKVLWPYFTYGKVADALKMVRVIEVAIIEVVSSAITFTITFEP